MIGIETSLASILTFLVRPGKIDYNRMVELMSVNPRKLVHLPEVKLAAGSVADLTVFDTVLLGRRPYIRWTVEERDREIVHGLLQRLKLEELMLRPLHELSGGEAQKVLLARALAQEPRLLLLDEPTSNLDSLNEAVILRSLKEESAGKTVVLVSHRKSTVRIADKVVEMENGRMS